MSAPDTVTARVHFADADIARGRALVAQANRSPWDLGDYALELIPIGDRTSRNDGSRAELAELAELIGIEPISLRMQRQVADQWPADLRRSAATWGAHKQLGGPAADAPHRAVILDELAAGKSPGRRVTADDVRRHLGGGGSKAPTEQAVDLALDVLDRVAGLHKQLDKAERKRGDRPWPERKVRERFRARVADVENLAERVRQIGGEADA